MLLMPDEDLDESGKYRLGARRISSDPFLLDYPGFHRGERSRFAAELASGAICPTT